MKSDPDASWTKKRGSNGKEKWWYGFKGHLMVDANYEIPIAAELTTAARHDSKVLPTLLRQGAGRVEGFQPKHVLADAGYDTKAVYACVMEEFDAAPVVRPYVHGPRNPLKDAATAGGGWRMKSAVPPKSGEWNRLYDLRPSVERAFSRLKEFRKINSIWTRGFEKVAIHYGMGVLVMQAGALAQIEAGRFDHLRACLAA